jgi:hypothetical protein
MAREPPPRRLLPTIVAVSLLACSPTQAAISNLDASYRFLVSDRAAQGGALYTLTTGPLTGRAIPLSYYDSAEYWGAYVCRLPGNACNVKDIYNPSKYSLRPLPGPAGDLQTERVNTHNGTNIYDAATWQIAVVLGEVANGFGSTAKQDAFALANNLNALLHEGFGGKSNLRATTTGDTFLYNSHVVASAKAAYAFRMLSHTWLSTDPLAGTRYASLISTSSLPNDNRDYQSGKVTWSDWKPFTGENAWAFLLGPLHAAFLHYVRGTHGSFVPFRDIAVQNALDVLPTFASMQSQIGGVYYAPSGTLANYGDRPVNPHQVSVENNFSLYAGLKILQSTLRAESDNEKDLTNQERLAIKEALATVRTMINGGSNFPRTSTKGLLAFFRDSAWLDGAFVQGGLANDPGATRDWIPALEPKAVDVNTWGIAALGAPQVDRWFGFGASFKTWQSVKRWGGYGVGRRLWGVGYSDQDGNGMNPDGTYQGAILSAEWTAGAVNMVRNMLSHYGTVSAGSASYAAAQEYVRSLKQDESAMLDGVQGLRADNYQSTPFAGKPAVHASLVTQAMRPYLYASRRFFIPFGWYANPIPSTCSTAWIIMLADSYDPFGYGGVPN